MSHLFSGRVNAAEFPADAALATAAARRAGTAGRSRPGDRLRDDLLTLQAAQALVRWAGGPAATRI